MRWAPMLVLAVGCAQPSPVDSASEPLAAPPPTTERTVGEVSSPGSNMAATASPPPAMSAPPPAPSWVEQVLRAHGGDDMGSWLAEAASLRLQVLVTVLSIGPEGPRIEGEHAYRVDAEYVYPASAIKTFVAVATLRHLRKTAAAEGDSPRRYPRFKRCDAPAGKCEVPKPDEDSDPDDDRDEEKLRVDREVRKLLAYSDNESFDRFYDLLGHRTLNASMVEMGFPSVRIHHRLTTRTARRTARRVLLLPLGAPAIRIPARTSDFVMTPTPARRLDVGDGYREGRKVIEGPMNFGEKNYASLRDLHRLHMAVVFPSLVPDAELGLSPPDHELLVGAMTGRLHPGKRGAVHKPMLPGLAEVVPKLDRLRYVNKSGRAYGFHLENAYVEDTAAGRGFFVTASIYANPNGILNDDDYAYEETSAPFLAAVGRGLATRLFSK
ncbi:MAG: serine hydrolase [Myxococcota bacterium]